MSSTSSTKTTSSSTDSKANTPPAGSLPATPGEEVIHVESAEKGPSGMPMQGVNAVEVHLAHDGFGHWRAMNDGADAPAFTSRDDLVKWVTTTMIPGGTVVSE